MRLVMRMLSPLAVVLALFVAAPLTFAQVKGEAVISSADLRENLKITRELLTRPPVRAFLKAVFKDELTISEEMQKKYGEIAESWGSDSSGGSLLAS